jgi:peptide/nickel transport system permease protein
VTRFIAQRIGLALVTLWLLSVVVFVAGQVLPGDPARAILGPLATPDAVANLGHQLGTDQSLIEQYRHMVGGFLDGTLGTSYTYKASIGPILGDALVHSLQLALIALILVVPLGIVGGVVAALHVGRPLDRIISIAGLSATVVPEFVSGIVLILVFGLWLNVLPISANWPPGSGIGTQVYHLILPALPLTLVLFGYIARMTRAGTVEALDAHYTRTAVLKGLPRRTVIRRHVLRNSLLPTITVIATQTGYLIGGLVVVESLFDYDGIGSLIFAAAKAKDFPMLEAGVLVIGAVYMVATLAADIAYSVLNPRIRLASDL